VGCSTYAKEETDAVFREIRVDNIIGVGNTCRKESFK
jgi:hypothetical protein